MYQAVPRTGMIGRHTLMETHSSIRSIRFLMILTKVIPAGDKHFGSYESQPQNNILCVGRRRGTYLTKNASPVEKRKLILRTILDSARIRLNDLWTTDWVSACLIPQLLHTFWSSTQYQITLLYAYLNLLRLVHYKAS